MKSTDRIRSALGDIDAILNTNEVYIRELQEDLVKAQEEIVTLRRELRKPETKEWENTGKAYNIGDLVTRYGMTWKCTRPTRQNEVCWGPEDAYCQHWEKAGL